MIDYGFDNYTYSEFKKKNDIIKTIDIENATKETKILALGISDDIIVFNNKSTVLDEIKPEIELNKNISAPISKGQELGTVKYTVDGLEYSAKLIAENNVELKTYYVEIGIGVGIFIIIVLLFLIIFNKK